MAAEQRLESWKEIAAYLRRGVRTVRRWEKEEGLPVHRQVHKKLGTVYAHASELDRWREGRRVAALPASSQTTASTGTLGGSTRLMIAVLPFENLTGTVEQEYVTDGLTEEMIGQLGRFSPETLGVIARTTVMRYKRTNKTVRRIAEELNVDYIVEGSLRREGDRVRVAAQLIHARDQAHVWSRTYEQTIQSILMLQHDLARDIGQEIRLKLAGRHASSTTDAVNADAYYAHLKGRHFLNAFTPESVRKSVELFRHAISIDPAYAPAHASLAEAYAQLPVWADEPSASTLRMALDSGQEALRLDADLPEAYASLGSISANYLWDWERAEQHFRRALDLNPGCSQARQWYAEFLAELGRFDMALDTIDQALRHDPLSRSILSTRAFVLVLARRYDEAIAQAESVLEIDPEYPMALIRLGIAHAGKGAHAAAISAFQRAATAAPALLDCKSLLAYAYALAGNTGDALRQLDELAEIANVRYVPAFLRGNVHLGLGEFDEAVSCFEQECDTRGWYLLLIGHGPQFDPLRSHAGFQTLLRRMNFGGQRATACT